VDREPLQFICGYVFPVSDGIAHERKQETTGCLRGANRVKNGRIADAFSGSASAALSLFICRRVIATESADLSAVTKPEIEALAKRHMIPVL
jgi:hypothetical protein